MTPLLTSRQISDTILKIKRTNMLKIYEILSLIGGLIWIPSIICYVMVPSMHETFAFTMQLGVMIYGIAHIAGMSHYKTLYDKVNQ